MKPLILLALVLLIAFPACAQVDLGTSASSTNPQVTGDTTTGLFSPTSDAVSVSSGGTEMMRVNGTGVGIGTTSPITSLTIGGGGNTLIDSSVLFNIDSGTAAAGLQINGYNDATKGFEIENYNGGTTIGAVGANANLTLSTNSAQPINFNTNGSQRMIINSSGDVGVGTTSPLFQFHLLGTSNAPSLTSAAGLAALATNSTVELTMGGYTASPYGFWLQTKDDQSSGSGSGASYPLLLNPLGGNVGIGTTSPANLLDIGGSGGIHITSGVPSSTSNALYNNSGTLTWNGSALAATSSISGTTNYIPLFTSSTAIGNSVLSQSGSNLNVAGQTHITSSSLPVLEVEGTTANTTGTVQIIEALAHSSGTMASSFGPVIGFWIEDTGTLDSIASIGAVKDGASNTGDLVFNTTLASTSTEKMRILSSGNVGIGTTTPAQALEVNGEVQIDGWATASATSVCRNNNVLSTCSSSIRYKENVKNFTGGLDDLMRMRPVKFKWKGRDENDFGLVAEEMRDINPLYVTYQDGRIEGVKYPQLTAVIVNAVKEQQQEIADLKREIADLKVAIKTSNILRSESH
jgi:hypothetical protein